MTVLMKTRSDVHPLRARLLAASVLLGASLGAHADRGWEHGRHEWGHEHRHHGGYYERGLAYGVSTSIYLAPRYPVYVAPPVVYSAPRYYTPPPVYYAPPAYYSAPVYGATVYEQTSDYPPAYYSQPYYQPPAMSGAPLLNRAVLGAAGGLLGSQFGHGDGRAAATAAGAVAGWVLGGSLGR